MKAVGNYLKNITFLILSTFLLLGCSKDYGPPDLEVNYVLLVFPEGAGTIDTKVIERDNGVYTIQLTAIPSTGYSFSHWLGSDCSFPSDKENPCSVNFFGYRQGPVTVKASAVFEAIE